jgi:hypothetical protein
VVVCYAVCRVLIQPNLRAEHLNKNTSPCTMASHAGRTLRQLIDNLEYGPYKEHYGFYKGVASCLENDARLSAEGPLTYFVFETSIAPGDPHPISIPNIPVPAADVGTGARGWSFACWLRISSVSTPSAPEHSRSVRQTASLLAKFSTSGGNSDVELWLSPTDTPKMCRLALKSTAASGTGTFRSGRRSNTIEVTVKLASMKWHHIAVSQTQPYITVVKASKACIYVDGRLVLDQELPCPALPFTSAVLGANLDGSLAHPQLYAERMPFLHVAAMVTRGPNAPTLHHSLLTVVPGAVPGEIMRAGLVTGGSLDSLHEGLPMAGAVRGTAAGLAGTAAVPPLLLHLDSSHTFMATSVNSEEGCAVDQGKSVGTQFWSSADEPGVHSKAASIPHYVCPVIFSKGIVVGDAAANAKKTLPAITGNEVSMRPVLPVEKTRGSIANPSVAYYAILGAGVRVVSSLEKAAGSTFDSEEPSGRINTLSSWRSIGGITTVLGLLHRCPWPHLDPGPTSSALRKLFSEEEAAEAISYLHQHLAECDAVSVGDGSLLGPALALGQQVEPMESLLALLASLLMFDFNHREEMFQLRGFECLAHLLRTRVRESPVSRGRSAEFGHPLNEGVWKGVVMLVGSSKYWGAGWNPLFTRAVRFLLSDWKLWTEPALVVPRKFCIHVAMFPDQATSLSEQLSVILGEIPIDPVVSIHWSEYMAGLACSSPANFRVQSAMVTQTACDAFGACLRNLAVHAVQLQLRTMTDSFDPSHLSSLLDGLDTTALRVKPTSPFAVPGQLTEQTKTLVLPWLRLVRILMSLSLGAPVPCAAASGDGRSVEEVVSEVDPVWVRRDISAVLQLISVLCEEHRRFQAFQLRLMAAFCKACEAAGDLSSVPFPVCAPYGIDPYSIACAGLLDLLNLLLRYYPARMHEAFEGLKGTMAVASCAEADDENVRVAVLNILAAIIALRRNLDPSLYGEDGSIARLTDSARGDGPPSSPSLATTPLVAAGPSRASVLSAKDKQQRLLRVVYSALTRHSNSTSVSAVTSLQLVLAPDVTGEGKSGVDTRSTALRTLLGQSRPHASSFFDELVPASLSGDRKSTRSSMAAHATALNALSDADSLLPGSLSFDFASMTVSSSVTSASTAITCPEALPIVFLLLRQSQQVLLSSLDRHSLQPASMRFLELSLSPKDFISGYLPEKWGNTVQFECSNRMRTLMDLSVMVSSRGPNVMAWMRQPGWQLWLLDIVAPAVAETVSGPLFRPEGGELLLSCTSEAGMSYILPTGVLQPRFANVRDHDVKDSLLALSSFALNMLESLIAFALEVENGWRVWMSTVMCISEHFRSVHGRNGVALRADVEVTLASLIAGVMQRVHREKPKMVSHLRLNIFNTVQFALCRCHGSALSKVLLATLPLLRLLKHLSKITGQVTVSPPSSPDPPRVESLSGSEVWLILQLAVKSIPALAGVDWRLHVSAEQALSIINVVAAPNPDAFGDVLSFLHQLLDEECRLFADPDAPPPPDVNVKLPAKSEVVGGTLRTILKQGTYAIQDMLTVDGLQSPAPVSAVPPSADTTDTVGSRVDALLFVLYGLARSLECSMLVAKMVDASGAHDDISSTAYSDSADTCSNIAMVLALALLNNESWGVWQSQVQSLTDEAYMHNKGRRVRAPGAFRPPSLDASAAPTAPTSREESNSSMLDIAFDPQLSPPMHVDAFTSNDDTTNIVPPPKDRVSELVRSVMPGMSGVAVRMQSWFVTPSAWMTDLLACEGRVPPSHPCTLSVDESPLSKFRVVALTELLARQAKDDGETSRADYISTHWHALQTAFSRVARVSLRQRMQLCCIPSTVGIPAAAASDVTEHLGATLCEPVKVDSHESRSRSRVKLTLASHEVINAPTYAEYGKMSGKDDDIAKRKAMEAALKESASRLDGIDNAISKQLALAGAIKDVAIVTKEDSIVEPLDIEDAAPRSSPPDEDELSTDARAQTQTGDAASSEADDGDGDAEAALATAPRVSIEPTEPDLTLSLPQKPRVDDKVREVPANRHAPVQLAGKASMVKATGYSPGVIELFATGAITWRPRTDEEFDAADENAHMLDPDAIAAPRRQRKWHVSQITAMFLRCFRLLDCAVEIFIAPYGGPRKRRYFFAFEAGAKARDEFVRAVSACMPRSVMQRLVSKFALPESSKMDNSLNAGAGLSAFIYGSTSGNAVAASYVQIPRSPPPFAGSGARMGFSYNYQSHFHRVFPELLAAWRQRKLSNFDYLMVLNTLAGRTFNDLTQYPVFPWVLCDYTSPTIDLVDPGSYRDLSRPMGALTSERLKEFRSRYQTFDDDTIPKFLYGSHYSTAVGTVVHYMVRQFPFTKIHLAYQDGHFDVADRLFSSVADAWLMNTHHLSEVKELTPEWYSQHHFLLNYSRYNFGALQDAGPVDHVRLPPWARDAPHFIQVLRQALESEWVSQHLHAWVDLVFGYKQRGPAAVAADNVFYYLTYAGGVDIDAIEEPALRKATQMQITHYGQTPLQLLREPHPCRGSPPIALPTFLPSTPWQVALDSLSSGAILQPKQRRADIRDAAKRTSGVASIRKIYGTMKANVFAMSAAAAGAVANVKSAVSSSSAFTVARPLLADLNAFCAICSPTTASLTLNPGLERTAALRGMLSNLPFELLPSCAFSHVCSVMTAGHSVWKVDVPSEVPCGLQMLFGAAPAAAPTQPASCSFFSFGDVIVEGGSPPAGTLVLRVLHAHLASIIDTRGPLAPSWPRAFPDPYTTSFDRAYTKAGDPHVGFEASSKPFAFPLKFHLVCELPTAISSDSSVSAIDEGEVEDVDTGFSSSALSKTKFHVWWPIAPAGYVALGSVVTAATVTTTVKVADKTEDGRPPQRSIQSRVRPTPPAADAVVCPHLLICQPCPLGTYVPVAGLALNIPPKPREEQLVFRGWGKKGATGAGEAARSRAPTTGEVGVLRGWNAGDSGHSADAREEESDRIVAPEDEWVVNESVVDDASNVFAATHLEEMESAESEAKAVEVDEAAARSVAAQNVANQLYGASKPEKVARVRANRSKAFALYGVSNRMQSFVVPSPVSIQRFDDVQARMKQSSSMIADKSASGGGDDVDEFLSLAFASASKASAQSADAILPDFLIASTPFPPVPEPCDAAFHKAFNLATAVAYDLHADLERRITPAVQPFQFQHWSADSTIVESAVPVACVKVLGSMNVLSSILGGFVPAAMQKAALVPVPPNSIITINAQGTVERFVVSAVPSYAPSEIVSHVGHLSRTISALMKFPDAATEGDCRPASATDARVLVPHSRIRLTKVSAEAKTAIPLVTYAHRYGPRSKCSYPVVMCDMAYGAFAVSGLGNSGSVEIHAIDVRPKSASASEIGKSAIKKSPDDEKEAMKGEISVAAAMSLHSTTVGSCPSALALDQDVLLVGYSDGSACIWRLTGMDALSSVLSYPTARSRPDVILRGPCSGSIVHVAVSRDDDVAVICSQTQVWVFEITRGRLVQSVCCDSAASVITAAFITHEGGLMVLNNSGVGSSASLYSSAYAAIGSLSVLHSRAFTSAITSAQKLRGGGSGDYQGPGALIALGFDNGGVCLMDSGNLTCLVTWTLPKPVAVTSIDLSPDLTFLAVGSAAGTLATFALPAFVVGVLCEADASADGLVNTLLSGAVAVSTGILTQVENAKVTASKASSVGTTIASEATSAVRGFFGSMLGVDRHRK